MSWRSATIALASTLHSPTTPPLTSSLSFFLQLENLSLETLSIVSQLSLLDIHPGLHTGLRIKFGFEALSNRLMLLLLVLSCPSTVAYRINASNSRGSHARMQPTTTMKKQEHPNQPSLLSLQSKYTYKRSGGG